MYYCNSYCSRLLLLLNNDDGTSPVHMCTASIENGEANQHLTLQKILPRQLMSLAAQSKPEAFASMFNAHVASPDMFWNAEMRRQCAMELRLILHRWTSTFTARDETPPSDVPKRVRYPLTDDQLQVANVFLRSFLTAHPNSFVMPLDVHHFARELFRCLRIAVHVEAPSIPGERRISVDEALEAGDPAPGMHALSPKVTHKTAIVAMHLAAFSLICSPTLCVHLRP